MPAELLDMMGIHGATSSASIEIANPNAHSTCPKTIQSAGDNQIHDTDPTTYKQPCLTNKKAQQLRAKENKLRKWEDALIEEKARR